VTAVVIAAARAVISVVEPRPRPALPSLVPAWLDRVAQFSWRTLILIGLGALLVAILVTVPLVVLPVLVALILTATLEPSVAWLHARGHTRGRATAIALGGGTLLVTAALALAVVALVQQVPELTSTVTTGASSADESAGGYLGLLSDAIGSGAAQTGKAILELADQLASVVTVTILGILLTFYFLRDGGRLWEGVTPHLQSEAEPQVRAVGERAFDVLGGYMTGTGAVSFVGAASQWVIMVVLGLPLAFPVFVLSFFLGYIPYIGSLISTCIAFLIAVAVGDPIDVVIMGIWTIVFNLVVGNVVSPLVYERTVHIHPAIVLVAIPAGSAIAGPIGMFVAVPAVGIVAATWRTVMALLSDSRSRGLPGQTLLDAVAASAPESPSAAVSP
jgi:predicted PurR-regulated permease PerM